jgi:hypothetical protein
VTYRGYTVLELEPDRVDGGTSDTTSRTLFEMNSQTGVRDVAAAASADEGLFEFAWSCVTRDEVAALRAFVIAQLGRAVPFWCATWTRAFELAADHGAGVSIITVESHGYAANVYPVGRARRHVAIRAPGGAFTYRQITHAVDNGDGTESLSLEYPVAEALPRETFISFLRFSRLDTDEPKIEWLGGHTASALIPMRELPQEVPA